MVRSATSLLVSVVALAAVTACRDSSDATAVLPQDPVRPTEIRKIASKDGTLISMECAGAGPSLLIVHGGVGDRTRWTPMFPLLSPQFTVCAMDRRGHGLSADSADYSLQMEAEDVAAAVDTMQGTVFVLGHSYGGVGVLEATFLTDRISKLVLYEPPVQVPIEKTIDVADKMELLIKRGEREQALIMFQTEGVGISPEAVAAMQASSAWPELVATIDLQLRQNRAMATYRFDAARMATVRQPTLLVVGGATTTRHQLESNDLLEAAMPHVTRIVLEGQEHNAMDTAREVLAETLVRFLLGSIDEHR